ncbi:MAG: tetraacyldisaccharide 4'-kinase [Alphaproteobacteria bacterium]|jgi:tetraacyldisaccharide 4'-kinase|nr:tetraacyldisaccharide 4'-kinase [Alphaproteobacteria bacterium]
MKSPAFWWQPHLTLPAALLWPLAALYGAVAVRHGAWRAKRAYYAAVPVISVGNLTVGGSGKTPLVQALAQHYATQGLQVAVVLRGYGGHEAHDPLQVTFQHTAAQVGDEALALFRALPRGVQVWVGRHRPSVVRRAEAAGAGLIILDDGFQRRDVARDADLLVLNGHPPAGQHQPQPFGNGLCLPAGPLREPLAGRTRASWAVVLNEPPTPPGQALPYYGLVAYRVQVQPTAASLAPLQGHPVVAFAGLGHPEKFFSSLRQAGLTLATTVALPDHVRYRPAQLAALQREAQAQHARLATTSKDAAKLPQGFAQVVETTVSGADWPSLLAGLAVKLGR